MKILSALIPIVALSSCAATQPSDDRTVPTRFQGEWNSVLADCGTGDNDSMLVISADEMRFYESSGPVRGAFLDSPNDILIVTTTTGEGETSTQAFRFVLSADGNALSYLSEIEEPFVRYRCPVAGR